MHIRMESAAKFDWNRLRAFLVTAQEGSLSAAARKLGQTQPTLGRQVTALEEELGIVLFERVGRGLVLTPAGQDLLEHARQMDEAANQVSLVASGRSQTVEGKVRITASDVYSSTLLPPILHRIRQTAPRLEIEVVAANDLRDLMRREADIAIRHVRPEQPDLIARWIKDEEWHLYASSDYIARRGRPKSFQEMGNHDFLSFGKPEEMMGYLRPFGIPLTEDNFHLGSESGLVTWMYAQQGFGILPMADKVAETAEGMEKLLPDMERQTFPVWLTTHRELHKSKRIRLVYDVLAEFLAEG